MLHFVIFTATIFNKEQITMTSFNTATWMRDMFDTIKDRTLGEICMPGSHDSAMSIATSCTDLGAECNTRTQDRNIADQLADGVRYFDIRALIGRGSDNGKFRTGHFGDTGWPLGYQGCFGEQMSEVLSAVAGFVKSHPSEFIILGIMFKTPPQPPRLRHANCKL